MSLNSSDTSLEFSQPIKDTLSKAQKNVIDRVVLILESDPELNKTVSEEFKKNLLSIVSDSQKFNLLLEKLGTIEMGRLGEIEAQFNKKDISSEKAISESKKIIEQYTNTKLTALKSSISPA